MKLDMRFDPSDFRIRENYNGFFIERKKVETVGFLWWKKEIIKWKWVQSNGNFTWGIGAAYLGPHAPLKTPKEAEKLLEFILNGGVYIPKMENGKMCGLKTC